MTGEIENEQSEEQTRRIPPAKYNLLVWTEHEKLFRERSEYKNKVLAEITVPFTIAFQVKLRRSVLGTYLEHMNENQLQSEFLNMNKFAIMSTVMENFNLQQWKKFDNNNNLFNDITKYLKTNITENEMVDCRFLYEHTTFLRMDDYHINMVDDGLKNFKNLQMLVVCGNWIDDIHGLVLPRSLKFLELYVNEIKSLENLAPQSPKHLMHLGLARNKLTNNSSLHLLAAAECFFRLRTLDLGECDIYRLVDVLESLKQLQNLESLCLQGNPCSMVMGYKDIVLSYFPYLIFLDGVEILKADRKIHEEFLSGSQKAELILMCSKLTGLPKPPKTDKKVKQTIHIEFVMPLFQERTIEEVQEIDKSNKDGDGKNKKTKEKEKKSKNDSKGKDGSKQSSKISPYERANEYDPKKINNSFQTIRKPWNNNMQFPPILLKSPENNLEAYRDSFRSCVNVRVVYLKFLLPEKMKQKGKKDKQDKTNKKKKDKQDKKSKEGKDKSNKSNKSTKSEKSTEKIVKEEQKPPTEEILKQVTIANFQCKLFSVTWKDGIHFYWSDEPTFGNEAVEFYSYFERLRKAAEEEARIEAEKEKEKLEKKRSDNKKSKTAKSKKDKKSSKKSKPASVMSCQVSFGLSRLGQELKEAKSPNDIIKKGKAKKG